MSKSSFCSGEDALYGPLTVEEIEMTAVVNKYKNKLFSDFDEIYITKFKNLHSVFDPLVLIS